MVLIPAGSFQMGTSEDELVAWLKAHPDYKREDFANQMPRHSVSLDAYYMYKCPVTVGEYKAFCKATGSEMPSCAFPQQDNHPVVNVPWAGAKAYAKWAGVSLPTEAQWERAARGGDSRVYPWGNEWPPKEKVENLADATYKQADQAGHTALQNMRTIDGYDDGYVETSPVGTFTANPFGLYDLAGNVRQWCADWYGDKYYKTAPGKNPTGPATGTERVLRGGGYLAGHPGMCRPAFRSGQAPALDVLFNVVGFRCVLNAP